MVTSLLTASCASQKLSDFYQKGKASWYGVRFHHHKTANGEFFDMRKLTAAHRTLPFGTILQVRSTRTSKEIMVRINDRGPFIRNRIIDLSYEAARKLEMLEKGEEEVEIVLARQKPVAKQ